ncbi:hypothetical protein QA640_44630 (plasmid) [Bradyrhizobium sp. CB82]|uniref:hypothetical protein n=1 Tax=Bradyrhizobium sp. CB82 TaxID=3039159 RepID=UPI0024B20421|nr:hypothetical protein [Bradyrhizobium sp. CB82]WFU45897.1 hypothetical protein QA640_44630 [Bradyrhizobium sp. CB82]
MSGRDPTTITTGAMTYQLRRLRLNGLIAPPNNFRYCVTDLGCRVALFFTRTSTAFCDLASPPHCQRCEPLLAPLRNALDRLVSLLRSRPAKAPTPWTSARSSPLRFVKPSNFGAHIAVSKLDRLNRDVHFISGPMTKLVPFIVAQLGRNDIYAALAEKERAMISETHEECACQGQATRHRSWQPKCRQDEHRSRCGSRRQAKGLSSRRCPIAKLLSG